MKTKDLEKWQVKRFNQLLNQLKMKDPETKQEMIYNATGGRVRHTSDMKYDEIDGLIKGLEKMLPPQKPDPSDRMRKKVISCCHEMGMHLPGSTKIDMHRVNELVKSKGKYPKPLNDYTAEELRDLVFIVEKIRDHYLTKKANEQY